MQPQADRPVPVEGVCDERFTDVLAEFVGNFAERGEVGAAVTVIVDGEVVVDLVGGWADEARTRPWRHDTLVDVYSAGKGVASALLLQLVDRGLIGLDTPIAECWPEFAAGGKQAATVRHALTHRAGVPAIAERLTDADLWDWERMTAAVAATPAWFEPGSRVVYHTNTFGHLVGEIIRRVSGDMPGDRLRAATAGLDVDLWFGVPEAEQHRCADVIWAPSTGGGRIDVDLDALEGEAAMVFRGYFNPPGYSSQGVVNTARWRAAQVPSTNGHGTAASLARFYAALLEPGRILSPGMLADATRVQAQGHCPVLGEEVAFGLGLVPTSARRPLGPHPGSFGHFGTGGALGMACPTSGVAVGYVMNHVIPRWQSTRNRALLDAVFASL